MENINNEEYLSPQEKKALEQELEMMVISGADRMCIQGSHNISEGASFLYEEEAEES